MKTIGITGGVGAGKSSVLDHIGKNYNCKIIYADDLAKELEKKGGPCYEPLVELLGEDILGEDGEIVPKEMSLKVFNRPDILKKVNDIVHPAVKTAVIESIEAERNAGIIDYFFLEAALLIECGYREILDELWYVRASEDVRRSRLKESRGYSDEKIDNILASQLKDEVFIANVDHVIDNSSNLENTYLQIDKLLSK